MQDLDNLTIKQLRLYKQYLIGQIKDLQKKTRQIDKVIKNKIKEG